MRLLIFGGLFILSLAQAVRAQTTNSLNVQTRPISLAESIEFALQHNLDVQVSKVNVNLALDTLSAAYGDWDPFLSASGSHRFSTTPGGFDAQGRAFSATRSESDTVSAGIGGPGVGATGLLPSGLTYSLSGSASDTVLQPVTPFSEKSQSSATLTLRQPLLKNFWIDATRTNIKIGKNRLKYSELAFQFQVMTMVNNVAKAYYELIFSAENIKVQQAALDLAERLVAENKKRVQVGTLAPLDEKQAESQAASSRADLLKAQNDAATQENVLKGLMTDNYTELHAARLTPTEVLAAPVPVLSLNASWAMGLTQRPDLLQSRLDVEKQNIQIRYSYNQLFPQLDLIGSYGYAGSGKEFSDALAPIGTGSNPSYSFGAAVNFPLGNHAARAIYKSSKEQKKAFLLALKSLEQSILVQIDNAVKQVQNAFERVDATRQARAYAETALDAEQKKLESGKSTSFQVLQLQKNLTDARLAEIRALADFNKAQSDLHFQEGSILDKNHLKVDVK